MWAIIGPFLAKYWAKLLAVAALVGTGLVAGIKIMGALNKGKIERAERKAKEQSDRADAANQAAEAEKKKTEQVKEEQKVKEQVAKDEKAVENISGDSLIDVANDMFDS